METIQYECEVCDYFEALHGKNGKDYHDPKYKNCQNCGKRIENYRRYVEERELK